jgi:hypothetical protein
VHTLLGDAFLEPLFKHHYVLHIDGNRSNNKLDNLRRVTYDEMVKVDVS